MNRKFKDFSPRALLWLEVNLLESGGAYGPWEAAPGIGTREQRTPSISGNNALKALEKQGESEHF